MPETAAVRDDLAASVAVLEEFLAADVVVIGAPMYNFSVPSQLKAWIDRIAVAGRTFRYTEKGPEGPGRRQDGDRRLDARRPLRTRLGNAALEHQESYLRAVFGFLGMTDIRFVRAEGVNLGEEQRARSLEEAEAAIRDLAA